MRVPPLSPSGGGSPRGTPLDPFSPFLPSLKRVSRQPPEDHHIFYSCLNGGRGKGCRSPKERQNNVPMISTNLKQLHLFFIRSRCYNGMIIPGKKCAGRKSLSFSVKPSDVKAYLAGIIPGSAAMFVLYLDVSSSPKVLLHL